ncbi:MAG: methyltransferase domain-containing protein [Thermoplasmata archaeon]
MSGRPKPETDETAEAGYFTAPPIDLSFERGEYFHLLRMAGWEPKPKTNYDVASREFDNMRNNAPTDALYAQSMIRWGHIRAGCLVLDAGCGTGNHTMGISGACEADIFGLDRSPGMLSVANKKARGKWVRGDVLNLPFGNSAFDTVMMILVLQHVDDEPWAISEAHRVLRPGGRLLVATVSHSRIRKHIMRHFPGLVRIDLERFMPVPELKWHARNQGFAEVRGHIMRTDPVTTKVDALIDRFRRRYISTLALVPDGDFEKNLELFEKRVRAEYGDELQRDLVVTFMEATKF